jgi:hypothetical protein
MTPGIKERLIYGRFAACIGFLMTLASKTGFGRAWRNDSSRFKENLFVVAFRKILNRQVFFFPANILRCQSVY